MKNVKDLIVDIEKYMEERLELCYSTRNDEEELIKALHEKGTALEKFNFVKEEFFNRELEFDDLYIELEKKGYKIQHSANKENVIVELDEILDGERFKHVLSMSLDTIVDLIMNTQILR